MVDFEIVGTYELNNGLKIYVDSCFLFSKLIFGSFGLESLSSALVKNGAPLDNPIYGKFVGLIILKSTKYSNRKKNNYSL
jgi:hypothetical protein